MADLRKKRLAASLAAVVATEAFAGLYDDVLFPFAISSFGPLYGGVSVSVAAIIINFLMVFWYRRTETDWYGFEAEREEELNEAISKSFARRLVGRKPLAFIFLSIKDPFLAFAYLEGRKGTMAMNKRDWTVFVLANSIGIGFWLLVLTIVSESIGGWVLNVFGLIGLALVLKGLYRKRITSR